MNICLRGKEGSGERKREGTKEDRENGRLDMR